MRLVKFPDGKCIVVDHIVAILPHTVPSPHFRGTGGGATLVQRTRVVTTTGIEFIFEYNIEKVIGFIRTQTKDIFSIT